jgi:menaquinone-dependent protoporphyrinogen oxidase
MVDTTKKVLVAYGTRAGSTAGVAERISDVLKRGGFAAEAIPANEVRDVASYGAIVLGSAVRAGKLMPEALRFLDKNRAAIAARPFAAFIVCLTMKDTDEKSRTAASAYLEPVRARVKPLSEGLFAGVMDSPQGDYRKWDEVEAWAAELVPPFSVRKE